ncbi:MAG: mviN [Microbacterium sp.]|jgi:putative peptidoglycan lipid II flippase|uniref:murein biosynthesis integral membrane protein MurJ n=1 Tax=Microbacterium TaxID=33882 RepID=UPI0009BE5227|nr:MULTISPECIES: lipid II flippase MurJ [Microbacterium]MDF2047442.1 lipid II flippase MurJ [Microbacterium sp. Kw_RZR3]MDF2916296.1 mviN [Microbacterium sp.]
MASTDGRAALWSGIGNLASKGLAFCRNLVLAAAIGTALVADAYNVANNVPNMLYIMLGGGAIATVFVPQITRLAKDSQRRADEYSSLLLVAVTVVGLVLVGILIVATPLLISAFGGEAWDDAQRGLATTLSYWCLPQIVFYALYSVQTQILNSRGKFIAAAWVSSANSLTVLATCVPILLMGVVQANDPASVSAVDVTLLGAGALGGTIAQSALLAVVAMRSGFRLRLPRQLRGLGLRRTRDIGSWTLAASLCYQISNLVVVGVTARAGAEAAAVGEDGRGYSVYYYAFTLVTLIQSVLIATFGNILLARMAQHRASESREAATQELDVTVTRAASLVVPISGAFVALGVPLGGVLFARGNTSLESAMAIGISIVILGIGLVPYTLHMLLVRAFYAYMLPRPPMVSAVVVNGVWIVGAIASQFLAPPGVRAWIVAGVFVLAYWIDFPLKFRRLRTQLDFRPSDSAVSGARKLVVAGVVSTAVVGIAVLASSFVWPPSTVLLVTQLLVGGALFAVVYLVMTRRSEVSPLAVLRWLKR